VVNILLVFIGGAAGALSRYFIGQAINERLMRLFPWGTFIVNITGCIIIGMISAQVSHLGSSAFLLSDVGFVGAYTTFSSLTYETLRLVESSGLIRGLINPALSMVIGLLAVYLGLRLGAIV